MGRKREWHDPYCPQARMWRDDAVEWWEGCQTDFDCRCALIAVVREDQTERDYTTMEQERCCS
jgi:hypothetical protein